MTEYSSWFEPEEETQYRMLRDRVREQLSLSGEEKDERIRELIAKVICEENRSHYIPVKRSVRYGKRIFACLRGYDILQPLLEDEEVTEIMVNGPDRIYIEKDGVLIRTALHFESAARLEDTIQQMVGTVNRQVNELNPIADARLKDGSRLNVILPPIALNGPIMTIRKFRKRPIVIDEMIEWGTLTQEAAAYLQELVVNRYNLFVCGGTGAGKTTLLNVLSNFIPPDERIITIEDAAELRLSSLENVVTLETRDETSDGQGRITIRQLIRTSLRARPDRIIVGEVRGEEALDMLSAMNTGHEGSLSTGHANSSYDMISRIETMVLSGSGNLPLEAVRRQISSAIDIFVYISRGPDRRRRVTQIAQVRGMREGEICLENLFEIRGNKLVRTEVPLFRRKGSMEACPTTGSRTFLSCSESSGESQDS